MMASEKRFVDLVQQALKITHSAVWLDQIINRHHVVGFEAAPGLFVVAPKPSTPRELATLLALRQIESDALSVFLAGVESRVPRLQDLPVQGGLQ